MLLTRDQIPPDLLEFFEPAGCDECYVCHLVAVFGEVRRVLRDDGTVWLNLGDSYNAYNGGAGPSSALSQTASKQRPQLETGYGLRFKGLKPKDLVGIPWRVAFALQADGWYLRSEIVWSKPNPMPESVRDRPTRAHEQVFLLSKAPRYFYDADASREQHETAERNGDRRSYAPGSASSMRDGEHQEMTGSCAGLPLNPAGRNKRSVWEIATQPFPGSHFAVFPVKLVEPCILAGSSPQACGECGAPWRRVVERTPMVVREGPGRAGMKNASTTATERTAITGTMLEPASSETVGWESSCDHADDTGTSLVLDPFCGSGTVGVVALRHGRSFVGLELNAEYVELARRRIVDDAPLLNHGLEL